MTNELQAVFSEKEIEVIETCVKCGTLKSIPSALESAGFMDMTRAKEQALGNFLKSFEEAPMPESEVKKEFNKWEREGNRIETREQELYWQKRFDDERKANEAKYRGEEVASPDTSTALAPPPADTKEDEDLSEVELTKAEIVEILKTKGIKFNPNQSKAELSTLLEKNK